MDKNLKESFLALVCLGIGNPVSGIPKVMDWPAVWALANQHGLSAIVIDGIEHLPYSIRPQKEFLLQWIGEVMQNYERRYELYCRTIAEMAGFYNKHHFKMMLLKGYVCSLDWPKPNHRPCGDIDIWQFGRQKESDKVLAEKRGIKIDKSHHHHTVFDWSGFIVENHYDFINIHHHQSNVKIEKILKQLGIDDSNTIMVYGEKVYHPSANLHALYLIKHMTSHFSSEDVNFRQVLDWAFFVKKHSNDVDWKWLQGVLEEYGMLPLFNLFNTICVEDLGFRFNINNDILNTSCMNELDYMEQKERVLNEILSPEFSEVQPAGFFPRIAFKYRRWKANGWKHELCYKESRMSAFWSGVWNHILKPKTI